MEKRTLSACPASPVRSSPGARRRLGQDANNSTQQDRYRVSPCTSLPYCRRDLATRRHSNCTGCSKKTDPLDYFDDNFGKYELILTIFSLLQQENYGAQNLSYFSHLTFIMLPLYLAKQTLMLVSMSLLRHYCVCV